MSEFTPFAWIIARFLNRWPLRYTLPGLILFGLLIVFVVRPLLLLITE